MFPDINTKQRNQTRSFGNQWILQQNMGKTEYQKSELNDLLIAV